MLNLDQPKNIDPRSETSHKRGRLRFKRFAKMHMSSEQKREIYWWFTKDLQEDYNGSLKSSLSKIIRKNRFSPLFIKGRKHPPNSSRLGSTTAQIRVSVDRSKCRRPHKPQLSVNARVEPVDRPVDWDSSFNSLVITESWIDRRPGRPPNWVFSLV